MSTDPPVPLEPDAVEPDAVEPDAVEPDAVEPDAELEPIVVTETLAGERVDRGVALLTGWSRRDVQDLIERDAVLVDGRPVAKSRRLEAGSVIELLAEPRVAALPRPDPSIPIVVRYEDEHLAVIAKPAGLVVHPGAGNPDGTLVNGLLARFPEIATVGDPARPGIVHRLDRDTSGLLVVARTQEAYDGLVAMLSRHDVHRQYLALVWGVPDSPRGIIDAPIGRSVRRPTKMAVRTGGRDARTAYEVVETFREPTTALVECRLETGRTHQIRVHLLAIGHPVVGDAAYGGARPALPLARPFLHAAALGFSHPVTGEPVLVEEPLPPELFDVLAARATEEVVPDGDGPGDLRSDGDPGWQSDGDEDDRSG